MKKIAVIGAGTWGRNLVRNFFELGALGAVADNNPDLRAGITGEYSGVMVHDDYTAVLSDDTISGVAIATPAPTHYQVARECLLAGKDVFVEKPMTLVAREARELCEIAREHERILMVGHLLLYQPAIQFIHKFLTEGNLGRIYHLHQERKKLGRARYVENVTWSLGVHDLAVLLYLAGESPRHIFASGHCGLQKEVEDDVYVHMTFAEGIKAHLHNSWLWHENRRQLTVVGEKGILVFDEIPGEVVFHRKTIGSDLENQDGGSEVLFQGSAQPLRLELQHFLECIQTRRQPISSGANGLAVIEALERIMML